MGNTIAKAVKYLKTPEELLGVLYRDLYCKDLVNTNAYFTGADTVKYQSLSFGSYVLGDFSATTGYTAKDIVSEFKTLVLTQDKGDSIKIDRITEDEEVTALGIVKTVNRYIETVQQPAVNTYVFAKIANTAGVANTKETITNSNAVGEIRKAFSVLRNNNVKLENLILYIDPSVKSMLDEQTFGKGIVTIGNWNGNLEFQVQMINGAKIVEVPNSRLPNGVQFILVHKDACPVFIKYQESEFFDKIPNFGGRRMQADVGMYYDAFVYDELVKAVYVSKVDTYTLAFQDGKAVAGAVTAAPTTLTSLILNEGETITLPAGSGFVLATHDFIGWNTSDAFTANPPYADQAAYTMGSANATLYGCWVLKAE